MDLILGLTAFCNIVFFLLVLYLNVLHIRLFQVAQNPKLASLKEDFEEMDIFLNSTITFNTAILFILQFLIIVMARSILLGNPVFALFAFVGWAVPIIMMIFYITLLARQKQEQITAWGDSLPVLIFMLACQAIPAAYSIYILVLILL